MEQKYIVYMYKNKINEKKYIGITCQRFEYRCEKNGNNYEECPLINVATIIGNTQTWTMLYKSLTTIPNGSRTQAVGVRNGKLSGDRDEDIVSSVWQHTAAEMRAQRSELC